MRKQQHLYYLTQMGIETWRLRTSIDMACYAYRYSSQAGVLGVLLAEACLQNKQEQDLVRAIADAAKLAVNGEMLTSIPIDLIMDSSIKAIILLGKRLADATLANIDSATQLSLNPIKLNEVPVFISHAPRQLLENPELKASVWQMLKKAILLMKDVPAHSIDSGHRPRA